MNGTVLAGTNNVFEIECDDGVIRNCSIKGKVLKSDKEYYNPLAPGDDVEIEVDEMSDEKGQILEKDRIKTSAEDLDSFMQSVYQVADQYQGQFLHPFQAFQASQLAP